MLVELTGVNQTKECRIYSVIVEELSAKTPGAAFRELRSQYGRCSGKVYQDAKVEGDGGAPRSQHIGWVFEKRERYSDARGRGPEDYYIQHTWAMLLKEYDPRPRKVPLVIE